MNPVLHSAKQAIVIPPPRDYKGAYVTPTPFAAASETTVIYTSPDYARYELFRDLNSTHSKFELFMYQVRLLRVHPPHATHPPHPPHVPPPHLPPQRQLPYR